MLKDKNSSAIVAVKDLDRAKTFYSDVLGLNLADTSNEGMLGYRTGNTWLTVYQSDFAGTNQANAVSWDVGVELDNIVAGLKARGVTFEHYDDMGRQGDIHVCGTMRLAWFKDPDGNILHLVGSTG
ncbi:catechol 2,3-dioxygenase-like lactoylglutathione lyase family enzyme [Brevundimonas bullata]|jgi:catechol 2,3-dioxygenase-like lactoylglutathione lyase family enzyme|uniref:Catechol 2,3-dioxygenase-like lactoylglutathione lyase family enzyme n=1 Tax=Brevundimonas bullata TaxID=13160 RepID=A0A7W7IL61_9CAUL|nr:VOC family protein [Brevundimonas bullata]MBB4796376.1 catechol 2,3-dioxygenase-like lactoylglutathione lyase family enzyme [Brevundimonas bullata]MBB6381336.1 catechol 2,3-dioxygenase-like lactoylglutathione lyase family enzyme [Brevundimonas bullata]